MAAAEVASRPAERHTHKRPFASWVKRLTNNLNKSNNSSSKKTKKASKNNNPYPESGRPDYRPDDSTSTNDFCTPPTHSHSDSRTSYSSIPESSTGNGHQIYNSSRSAAPTVATNPETVHSDAGYSRALTGTTAGGALSSVDGAGANSTFSSPNQSQHSLTTTLTTIQSSNALNANPTPAVSSTGPVPAVQFTHQYPVTASAIPPHLQAPGAQQHQPTTYASATAHNLLTDNASILTLASSSKRRRRSMDTDASVRALAPHSVWGNSSESLPLSVLSGSEHHAPAPAIRSSIGGIRDERASVYSNPGVSAPALASERNSFYASSHKAPTFKETRERDRDGNGDGRSVRSIHGVAPDGKMVAPAYDGASLRGYEGSVRSGALGRVESASGSPLHSPSLLRRPSGAISLDGGVRENSIMEDREGH